MSRVIVSESWLECRVKEVSILLLLLLSLYFCSNCELLLEGLSDMRTPTQFYVLVFAFLVGFAAFLLLDNNSLSLNFLSGQKETVELIKKENQQSQLELICRLEQLEIILCKLAFENNNDTKSFRGKTIYTLGELATRPHLPVRVTAYCIGKHEKGITATGKKCSTSYVAVSRELLKVVPFGTKIRLLLHDENGMYYEYKHSPVFVEDTTHRRIKNTVDVFMEDCNQALKFGVKRGIILFE